VTGRRAVVTGFGVLSPVGIGADASWENWSQPIGITDITAFDTTGYDIHVAGEVKGFEATDHVDARDVRRHDRNTHFAVAATGEALRHAGLLNDGGQLDTTQADPDRFGMVVGTSIGGIGMISEGVLTLDKRGPDRVSPFLIPHMIRTPPWQWSPSSDTASVARTWPSSAPAPPVATRSARRWNRSPAARRTSCSAPGPMRWWCRWRLPASGR
jgi:3-oxoacyl-(acyl-carrier-protein) synthase